MARFARTDIRRILGENCTDEIENALIALHLGVVDPLKDELQAFKADAEKLQTVQKELDDLKQATSDYETIKQNYEKEHNDFENFKKNVEADKALGKIKDAYKGLLKNSKVDDRRIDAILRLTDFSTMKLGKDGKLENEQALSDAIKTDWSDYIVSEGERGTDVETPPAESSGKKISREDINKIKNTKERQKAIAENLDLYE